MKHLNKKIITRSTMAVMALVFTLCITGCGLGNETYVILDPDMVNALEKDGAANVKCDTKFILKSGNSGSCSYSANGYSYERTISVDTNDKVYVSKTSISDESNKVTLTFATDGKVKNCSPTGEVCNAVKKAFGDGVGDLNKQLNDSLDEAK